MTKPWEKDPLVKVEPGQAAPWANDPITSQQEPTFFQQYVAPAGRSIASAAEGVRDYFVGKEDPRFGALPSIDEPETAADAGLDISTLQQAKTVGFTDAQYRDILQKQLGNRFLGVQKDANGFDVITYAGADGRPRQAYVNKPGLDYQDVDRGLSATLPYLAAGGVAGRAVQGAPLVTRALTQAAAGATASAGQDIAAQGMGSQQGIDPTKAALAGAGGAAGEMVGHLLSRWLQKGRPDRSLVDDAGKLTEQGRRLVTNEGLDPDMIDGELAKEFARLSGQAADPSEALIASQTGQFGIETTKAQRTKNPMHALTEADMRQGTLGESAQRAMREFDQRQQQQLATAVRGADVEGTVQPGVAQTIAPGRTVGDQAPETLGAGVQRGFQESVDQAKALERQAWRGVGEISPQPGATDSLRDFVMKSVGGRLRARDLQPTSAQMIDELRAFVAGRAPQTDFGDFSNPQAVQSIGDMRKILTGYVRDAGTQHGDKVAARKIYDGYLAWVNDIAAKKLITGNMDDVQAMRKAMDVTKEVRGMIKPTDMGKKTPVTRVFERVEKADSGFEVLNALIGASGPNAGVKQGGIAALKAYEKLVKKHGGEIGKQAWNDVRLSYYLRLVTDKQGDTLTPKQMLTSINTAMHRQEAVMRTLFTKEEVGEIKRLAQALRVLAVDHPNPPKSGLVVRSLMPNLVAEGLETQAKRELFSKHNVLMSRIYRALAKTVKFSVVEKTAGGKAQARATSQALTPRRTPTVGGLGSAAATTAVPRGEEVR